MARNLLIEDETFEVTEADLHLENIEPDPDAVYTLRPLTASRTQSFAKLHTKPGRRGGDTDWRAVNKKQLDYCLVSWRGVNGDCDTEGKLKLPAEIQAQLILAAQAGQQSAEDKQDSFREPEDVV